MTSVRRGRGRRMRGIAVAAVALLLAGCTGLPTRGDVQVGLELDAPQEEPDFLPLASGPVPDATPEEMVEGFMEAAITPADDWDTARKFLTAEQAASWRPAAGVSIDARAASRAITPSSGVDDNAADGDTVDVRVQIDQIASVDAAGEYSEDTGSASLNFIVERIDGQWRIARAPDGVVIDRSRFIRVYNSYALQYFDRTWTRMVPDVRWFPRRATIATTITQALINGEPSPWLAPSVQSAFPADVRLARDAVPIGAGQVAEVALSREAAGLDESVLARMRTQLEQTFVQAGVHVNEVIFSVDGRELEAGVVSVVEDQGDTGPIVLTADAFGTVVGDDVQPIGDLSAQILGIDQPITAIDVTEDGERAAVQLADGQVYLAGAGRVDALDTRASLVEPSMDPYGYTWSVPSDAPPRSLLAWGTDVTAHSVENAWPAASAVDAIRVSSDGARVAAIVVIGGQRWVVVSAVIREPGGMPTGLGPVKLLTQLSEGTAGLVWLTPDRLGILVDREDPAVITQIVSGTRTAEGAPNGSESIAGARSAARVLGQNGTVFARSGTAWREVATGVAVLATRAGH